MGTAVTQEGGASYLQPEACGWKQRGGQSCGRHTVAVASDLIPEACRSERRWVVRMGRWGGTQAQAEGSRRKVGVGVNVGEEWADFTPPAGSVPHHREDDNEEGRLCPAAHWRVGRRGECARRPRLARGGGREAL